MKNGDLCCPSIFLKRFVRLLFCASLKMSSKTCNILKIPAPKVCSLLFLFRVLRAWHKKIRHNNLNMDHVKIRGSAIAVSKIDLSRDLGPWLPFRVLLVPLLPLFPLTARAPVLRVLCPCSLSSPVHFCHVEENNILNANVQHWTHNLSFKIFFILHPQILMYFVHPSRMKSWVKTKSRISWKFAPCGHHQWEPLGPEDATQKKNDRNNRLQQPLERELLKHRTEIYLMSCSIHKKSVTEGLHSSPLSVRHKQRRSACCMTINLR